MLALHTRFERLGKLMVMSPVRVLILSWLDWTHPLRGGAETYLRETASGLAGRGHDVTVLASAYDGAPHDEELNGVMVVRRGRFWTYGLELPWHYRRLVKQRGNWDVVVEYTHKVPLMSPVWAGRPVVAVAHHLWGRSIFAESPLPVALAVVGAEAMIPLIYRRVPWLAVSPSTCGDLVSRGIPRAHVTLAPNGINVAAEYPITEGAKRGGAVGPRVVWVGRVRRYKRLDMVLRAMVGVRLAVPDAHLEVVGDGPALPAAKRLAATLGLHADAITFHGAVADSVRDDILRRASILVQASVKEGWGRTVLEAGAFGVPSVVADVPGLRDAVADGETGIVVRDVSPSRLGAAIIRLLGDDDERTRLGVGASRVSRSMGWGATIEVAERVLAQAHSSRAHLHASVPPVGTHGTVDRILLE